MPKRYTVQQKILSELRREIKQKCGPKARGARYTIKAEITERGWLRIDFPPAYDDKIEIGFVLGTDQSRIHAAVHRFHTWELAQPGCIEQILDLVNKVHSAACGPQPKW